MPRYYTTIKAHTEAPDFEVEVVANNFKEAVEQIAEKYELDLETVIENTGLVEDETE